MCVPAWRGRGSDGCVQRWQLLLEVLCRRPLQALRGQGPAAPPPPSLSSWLACISCPSLVSTSDSVSGQRGS